MPGDPGADYSDCYEEASQDENFPDLETENAEIKTENIGKLIKNPGSKSENAGNESENAGRRQGGAGGREEGGREGQRLPTHTGMVDNFFEKIKITIGNGNIKIK